MAQVTVTRRIMGKLRSLQTGPRPATERHRLGPDDIALIVKALSFYSNDGAAESDIEDVRIWELVELFNHKDEWSE